MTKDTQRMHMFTQRNLMIYALPAALAVLTAVTSLSGVRALAAEKTKTVICLDPGHGGTDEGAKIEYDGALVMEKDINLRIAKRLRMALRQYEDVEVVMTRTANKEVSIRERIDLFMPDLRFSARSFRRDDRRIGATQRTNQKKWSG